LMLGQEQDTVGGHLDARQSLIGGMSDFNVHSSILTAAEIAGAALGQTDLNHAALTSALRFNPTTGIFEDVSAAGNDMTTVGVLPARVGPTSSVGLGDSDSNNLKGTSSADYINGLAGDDYLTGLEGDDVLTGGAGADTFFFTKDEGVDTITDFEVGTDVIDLGGYSGNKHDSFSEVKKLSKQDGEDVIIELSNNDSITLVGVKLDDLAAGDFLFG